MADTVTERVRRYRNNNEETGRVTLHADIQKLRKEQLEYLAEIHNFTLREMLELIIEQAYEAEQKRVKDMLFKAFEQAYKEGHLHKLDADVIDILNKIANELKVDLDEFYIDYIEWRSIKIKKVEREQKKRLLKNSDSMPQAGQIWMPSS